MKLQINTAVFQNMVAKAVKGAGMNNDLGITQLMSISLHDNTLTLTTTDNSNYLYIREDKISGDDFDVVVSVDKFSKLISKLTCENVVLEVNPSDKGLDSLVIKGNGKYQIELPYDEDGELVEFPNPMEDDEATWETTEINLSTVKLILSAAKPSLMAGKEDACYSGYYMGDRIVATDTFKICGIDIKTFDSPKLISARFMDLLEVMTEETIKVKYNEDTLIFSTDKVELYGHVKEGVESYKIDAISSLLDEKFSSVCKIEKSPLLQMLDRLSLFVETFDKNGVYLTFTKDGLLVSSKKDSGEELIPYKESSDFKDFTCCADIDLLRTQVKAYPSDVIELLYGKENSLKFIVGNTKEIVALSDDDRVANNE